MRMLCALPALALAGAQSPADVEILSSDRSIDGYVYLNWSDQQDSDSDSYFTTELGLFDANVDIIAEPYASRYIASQARHLSQVSPLEVWGQTDFAVQAMTSSGTSTGQLLLSSYLSVDFRVVEPVAFDFYGRVDDPATIWLQGPDTSIFVYVGEHSESGLLAPGDYSLSVEWAVDWRFDSGGPDGSWAFTPWELSLRLPEPGTTSVLVAVCIVARRRRR